MEEIGSLMFGQLLDDYLKLKKEKGMEEENKKQEYYMIYVLINFK
jgi:hypothetical protein